MSKISVEVIIFSLCHANPRSHRTTGKFYKFRLRCETMTSASGTANKSTKTVSVGGWEQSADENIWTYQNGG